MATKTPVKLEIKEIYIYEDQYEGTPYQHLVVEFRNGMKCKSKLTTFEKDTLKNAQAPQR